MELAIQNNNMATQEATLVVKLDEALQRFNASEWQEIRASLLAPGAPPEPAPEQSPQRTCPFEALPCSPSPSLRVTASTDSEWYEMSPDLVLIEKHSLSKILDPVPSYPDLFYIRERSRQLGAIGMARISEGARVKMEIAYPTDYPDASPKAFLFGEAMENLRDILREDGSLPLPINDDRSWRNTDSGATVVLWTLEWLEHNLKVEAMPA